MLKRNITFENLDGEMVTKEFHFNLSKAELIRLEAENDGKGGYQEAMQRIVDAKDGKAIMDEFENIIMLTVGERQGDQFVKSPEIKAAFRNSAAYDELFMELVTDAGAGAAFVNGVIPAHLANSVKNAPRPGQPQDYLKKDTTVELPTAPPVVEERAYESGVSLEQQNAFTAPQPAVPTNVPAVPENPPVQVSSPEVPQQFEAGVAPEGQRFSIQDFPSDEIAAADRANALRRDQRDPREQYRSEQ